MNAPEDFQEKKVANAVQEIGMRKAPFQFKDNVMQAIIAQEQTIEQAVQYKPLISKKSWGFIALTIVVLVLNSILFSGEMEYVKEFTLYAQSYSMPELQLPSLAITTPDFVVFSVLLIGLFIMIEMPLLRKYYERTEV